MQPLKATVMLASILGAGALFGFYFTMSVSIMPGLDATGAYAAITANQDIGRATQQSLFFVALLATPIALLVAIAIYWRRAGVRRWLVLSMIGWIVMMVVTFALNVPLNQSLDSLKIEPTQADLPDLWAKYSVDWQRWNWLRVAASGASLICVALAFKESSIRQS